MDTPHVTGRLGSPPPLRLFFSDHEEFLDELRVRGPNLEPLVRVTFRRSADASGAPLTYLTLLATYLRRVDDGTGITPVIAVVQLAEYIGSQWIGLGDQESQHCQRRAEELRAALIRAVEDAGLRAGAGAYVSGERPPDATPASE